MDLANMQHNVQKYKTENKAIVGFDGLTKGMKSKF